MEPDFKVIEGKPHLGGYIVGGDDATHYPELWRYLVEGQRVTSVLDVGCGEGHTIDFFKDLGLQLVRGVDGIDQSRIDIMVQDFTKWTLYPQKSYDLVWCCEVVEHVEEKYLPSLLEWLVQGRLVLMTHAEPGQMGYHHVNCQTADYWRGVMATEGYFLDHELTSLTRGLAGVNPHPHNHFKRSGLAFRLYADGSI